MYPSGEGFQPYEAIAGYPCMPENLQFVSAKVSNLSLREGL